MKRAIFLIYILFALKLSAQTSYSCEFVPNEKDYGKELLSGAKNDKKDSATGVYIIPVVVHVIYHDSVDNISKAQIQDAIAGLTRDYRKRNSDTAFIVPPFDKLAADCQIEFYLAQKDPNGVATDGITRTYTDSTGFKNLWNAFYDSTGGKSSWPSHQYVNIRVVKSFAGLFAAGRANGPGGPPDKDGIIITNNRFGSIGTSSPNRVITHEMGHFLSLLHIWGKLGAPGDTANCAKDDGVQDTPNCWGGSYYNGTITGDSAVSCGTLDNTQNYMDYVPNQYMFTKGQASRMQNALDSTWSGRNNLHSYANLINTGLLWAASAPSKYNETVVKVYPNPSNNIFNLQIQGRPLAALAEVYNMVGDKVWSNRIKLNNSRIDLSQFPSGMYMLKLRFSEGMQVYRLVKQ